MPYGAHETMEVHELLNEKMNLINHFSFYAQQAQNPELRDMIDRHLQTAMQSYDQLVAYTHDYNAATMRQAPAGMPAVQPQQVQYGLHQPAPQAPVHGQFDDRQIALSMLSCHKNSAKNHMAGSLECADPNVRQMLVNGAVVCSNQAYEVFLLLNRMGAYQVPTMQDQTAKTFLHAYQPSQAGMPAAPMGGRYN
ncbi:spore coat protein [Paenibacillus sp. GYB003]|uniref:spore coat protein n=1 Tax=Paenibacillus sp. GYB003 TaxID=2994392 RepID=UPI002F9671F7